MSMLAERCDRIREEVTLEALFDALGWDLPQRGRIRCIWPDHEDRSPSMQVYRDTNSVHCFACNRGGDVIEIAKDCANPEGGPWSLDDALDWLEETFGLKKLTPAATLQSRLRKKLQKARVSATVDAAQPSKSQVEAIVHSAFATAEQKASQDQLQAVGDMRDYIWSEGERPGVDRMEWATWARQMIYGSYAKLLTSFELPPRPADIVDDRPETVRRAQLWELHRGTEFPSLWHIQLI